MVVHVVAACCYHNQVLIAQAKLNDTQHTKVDINFEQFNHLWRCSGVIQHSFAVVHFVVSGSRFIVCHFNFRLHGASMINFRKLLKNF